MEHLKYPVGRFKKPENIDLTQRDEWIDTIASFPEKLKHLTLSLNDEQLRLRYRPGGWNIAQVVHHCADSHMQSYTRFKLAVSEKNPTIKPYNEADWATFADAEDTNITASLQLIEGLHFRWVTFLRSLTETDFERTYYHPESNSSFNLIESCAMYAWHCEHHLAHIKLALASKEQ